MRLAALAAGLLLAGITHASAETLTLQATVNITPVPPSSSGPPAIGDRAIFTDALTRDGKPAGKDSGECTVTSAAPVSALCSFAFVLADGTITTVFALDHPLTEGFSFGLLGGTGAYAGRTGIGRFVPNSDGKSETLTLAFADPATPVAPAPDAPEPHQVNPQ